MVNLTMVLSSMKMVFVLLDTMTHQVKRFRYKDKTNKIGKAIEPTASSIKTKRIIKETKVSFIISPKFWFFNKYK